jgi:hypothetical protein
VGCVGKPGTRESCLCAAIMEVLVQAVAEFRFHILPLGVFHSWASYGVFLRPLVHLSGLVRVEIRSFSWLLRSVHVAGGRCQYSSGMRTQDWHAAAAQCDSVLFCGDGPVGSI